MVEKEFDVGDTVPAEEAKERGVEDWGEEIDGRYTYVMVDEGVEYKIAIERYEVMETREIEQ